MVMSGKYFFIMNLTDLQVLVPSRMLFMFTVGHLSCFYHFVVKMVTFVTWSTPNSFENNTGPIIVTARLSARHGVIDNLTLGLCRGFPGVV